MIVTIFVCVFDLCPLFLRVSYVVELLACYSEHLPRSLHPTLAVEVVQFHGGGTHLLK